MGKLVVELAVHPVPLGGLVDAGVPAPRDRPRSSGALRLIARSGRHQQLFVRFGPRLLGGRPRRRFSCGRTDAGRWLRLLLWTIVGDATIWVYTIGYLPNPHHQPLAASSLQLERLRQAVRLRGDEPRRARGRLRHGPVVVERMARHRVFHRASGAASGSEVPEPVVWFALALGLAAFGAALLTGLGRVNFGTLRRAFVALRHHGRAVLGRGRPAARRSARVKLAGRQAGRVRRRRDSGRRRFAAAVAVMGRCWSRWPRAVPSWRLWHHRLAPARASLVSDAPDDDLLVRLYPNPVVCRERRAFLQARHLNVFRQR